MRRIEATFTASITSGRVSFSAGTIRACQWSGMKTYPVKRNARRVRTPLIASAKQAKSGSTKGNRVRRRLQVMKKIFPEISNRRKRDMG